MEKGKVKDWMEVKRNVRECAVMEGVATKSNKPMFLKSFLKEEKYKRVDVAIEAFSKKLGQMQGSGVSNETIVRNCLYEFWQKEATEKIICDGHLTIYKLLDSYKEYLTMKLYDDLMMLNKFDLELLTNVTVVPLLPDINEMHNI
eukprot:1082039-Ditylum_brightwellii.AAC.1